MKRYYLLIFTMLAAAQYLQAQSFSEWFKQKKTQKKYLLAQIAALQTYAKVVEKGYAIAKEGLSTVSILKEGDFLQHTLHFSGLKMVSPRIKNYSKVLAIAEIEDRSEQLLGKMMNIKDLDVLLAAKEIAELHKINDGIGLAAVKDLEQLELLVTDGKLKMTEDARIRQIDQLYTEVKDRYGNILIFVQHIQGLVNARKKQASDARILEQLYGR